MIASGLRNAVLYINAGLWYWFAPAVGGGSNKKAKEYLEKALQDSVSDYEKFYAHVYISQVEFGDGEKENCAAHLAAAEKILPDNAYLKFVNKLNASGFSYLEYTKNRKKVEAKLRS